MTVHPVEWLFQIVRGWRMRLMLQHGQDELCIEEIPGSHRIERSSQDEYEKGVPHRYQGPNVELNRLSSFVVFKLLGSQIDFGFVKRVIVARCVGIFAPVLHVRAHDAMGSEIASMRPTALFKEPTDKGRDALSRLKWVPSQSVASILVSSLQDLCVRDHPFATDSHLRQSLPFSDILSALQKLLRDGS